ncbi:Wadjet anti-phage system protein JetD domain-containing protein [Paenibacillus sanguinis]|uniref:Wadjet anti-phage system protein JetD domain-containing protein n=1 Tax=Paenibacillus sanguinis TaxID=225906 RepID=UPI000381B181|nr:Wadjet anti-phage system protein JetD domain-containing protein [Paenibacillus sanguinis]
MHIKQIIEEHIGRSRKSTIALEELESLFTNFEVDPREFAEVLLKLEQASVLEAVKSAGRTMRQQALAYRYRINKQYLTAQHKHRLQQFRLRIHPAIQLDSYFSLPEHQFEQDQLWIEQIDRVLKTQGLPSTAVPAPERSFQLTGNEKWITDLGGHALLKRLGLWELLRIHPVSDPLMLAINPESLMDKSSHCLHLIVENKTTYQALLPALPSSSFSTLIYGCGNKIIGNLDMFSLQYPVTDREHLFYYFGDLDQEGIRIWHEVDKQQTMVPALPFYQACLAQPYVLGKSNQRRNEDAVKAFIEYFPQDQQNQIETFLNAGGYYPQETLTSQQLQEIWRSEEWKLWTNLN